MNIDENIDFGYCDFNLKEIMEKKEVNVSRLAYRAELQRSQVYNFMNNRVSRLDLNVLSRLIYALGCDLTDIIEYHAPEEGNKKSSKE